ncbi:hypothetical protein BDQ17DRAFT_1425726 [Cyathus striatus]|nr:hypothetical protein BDQ17DRAFT_1425726 [Cyathus striatus]
MPALPPPPLAVEAPSPFWTRLSHHHLAHAERSSSSPEAYSPIILQYGSYRGSYDSSMSQQQQYASSSSYPSPSSYSHNDNYSSGNCPRGTRAWKQDPGMGRKAVVAIANPVVDLSAFSLVRRADSNVTASFPTNNDTSVIPFDSPDCKANSTCAPFYATNCSSDADLSCACNQSYVQAFAHCMECGVSKNDTTVNEVVGSTIIQAYILECGKNNFNLTSIQYAGQEISTVTNGAVAISLGLGVVSAAAGVLALLQVL